MSDEGQDWRSLPGMFLDQAGRRGQQAFLWRRQDGAWRATSWAEAAATVRRLAAGLVALGVKPGERVVLVAENRPEWPLADLAIMAAGAITVPTFTTNTTADHRHILSHSQAKAAILSGPAVARNFLPAAADAPELAFVVAMDDLKLAQRPALEVHDWHKVLALGDGAKGALPALATMKRDDVCCFIYTSGTGGAPKGVMLTHGSILCNCRGAHRLLADFRLGDEVFLSFLPLSHSYEHMAGLFLPIFLGAQIYYAESADKLMENAAETRPTIMTAVPRLYEAMHGRISRGVAHTGGLKRRLFEAALTLGAKKIERPGTLSLLERVLDLAAELTVRRKLRHRFGGRLKVMVSGGAALNPEIGLFFTALGLRILQGYGQTEASPVVCVNPPGRVKLATVGPPLDGVEVRIAEDGEILVRGELVMRGYWRDEAATAAALKDGWLHTGDIGRLDADGYLEITDRKKDIIVLSGGDNVAPARVENLLVLEPEIMQAMVHGDGHAHLVALLVPEPEFAEQCAAGGRDIHRALAPAVERVNARLSQIERIRRFAVAPSPFDIDNAMLTPSLKIRRHKIRETYGAVLEKLYDGGR